MHSFTKLLPVMAIFSLFALAAVRPARADTIIYANNFTTSTTASGVTATLSGGETTNSPNGTQTFREIFDTNPTLVLTFSGLAANSSVTLNFNLYAIQSLDGNGEFAPGVADSFNVTANGATLFNQTFANFESGNTQSFNGTTNSGRNAPRTGAIANNTLGYTFIGDATYVLSVTALTDSMGSVTFNFNAVGLQPRSDESFGIDNITANGTVAGTPAATTPEPATMLLLGTGLAGVAAQIRKRRRIS